MHRQVRGVIAALIAPVLLAVVVASSSPAEAAPAAYEPASDWYPTGLTERVTALFTPAGGAVYALQTSPDPTDGRTVTGFWRSDDHGKTWRDANLPPRSYSVWVDPTDPSIIYAGATPNLYKTTDGGATWSTLVIPGFEDADKPVYLGRLNISRADHQLLYGEAWAGSMDRLLLSHDGGVTWEVSRLAADSSLSCRSAILFTLPHGVDPARVLRVAGCSFVGGDIAAVNVSDDQGASWEYQGKPGISGYYSGVTDLVGFGGVMPERLYAVAMISELIGPGKQTRRIGRAVFRSDDEGRTWATILSTVQPGEEETVPSITSLTYDPADPDVVCVAMGTTVKYSQTAGAEWRTIGRRVLPPISALAIDATWPYLYAATDEGVYYLNLPV